MKTSESVTEILPALLKVKQELKGVAKTSNNPYFKSKYADLNSHIDAVEDLLQANGLILFQPVTASEVGNFVSTRISHAVSGQYVESTVKLVGEADMQKVGSAITYGRRYTLGSLLSMKAEDDDGNLASGKETKTAQTSTKIEKAAEVQATPKDRPSFRNYKKKAEVEKVAEVVTPSGDDL